MRSGVIILDIIENKRINESLRVIEKAEKITKNTLRWFGLC